MRRTNPFEPIEPNLLNLFLVQLRNSTPHGLNLAPYFPRTLSQKFDFGYNRIIEIHIDY